MIFLLQYNRKGGELVKLTQYEESDRLDAQNKRLQLELSLLQGGLDDEVVLLEADSLDALRQTHSRYFLNPREIAST